MQKRTGAWWRALSSRNSTTSAPPQKTRSISNSEDCGDAVLLDPGRAKLHEHHFWPKGWRGGVAGVFVGSCCVLTINIIFTIWATSKRHSLGDQGVIFDGSCSTVHTLDTVIHLMINIFGTILIAGSNYCMQILCAPTREDVDKAHAEERPLQIGIQSLSNLPRINRRRGLLWTVLALSSLPLHLFYNSTVYPSTATNYYRVFVVNRAFVQNVTLNSYQSDGNNEYMRPTLMDMRTRALNRSLDLLSTPADCIKAYGQTYLSTRSNLLIVTTSTKDTTADLEIGSSYKSRDVDSMNGYGDVTDWICDSLLYDPSFSYGQDFNCRPHINYVIEHSSEWRPLDVKRTVEYCYSQRTLPHCKLRYSKVLIIIVILFGIFKIAVISTLTFGKQHAPLLVLGDAISSYMTVPDDTTKGACLLEIRKFKESGKHWPSKGQPPMAQPFRPKKTYWGRANSGWRSAFFMILYVSSLITAIVLLIGGIVKLNGPQDMKQLLNMGIGQENSETLLFLPRPAWIPTPYYNGLFTSMLAAREWSRYAWERKGLRVSTYPRGEQRSTYWLQLPYRFALPILGFSSLLHWLVSQSLFLVSIVRYNYDGTIKDLQDNNDDGGSILALGWSPLTVILALILSTFMFISAVIAGNQTYKPGIPVAGASSAVISAACHVHEDCDLSTIAERRLRYGVVREEGGNDNSIVGHCAFSSSENVEKLVEGELYA